jgi:hypothetical protein
MKKLVLSAALFAALGSITQLQANNEEYTHLCICERENQPVDCNAECKKDGGWSGKAALSNKHSNGIQGVTCYCNDERNGHPVKRPVKCHSILGGKCGLGRGGSWQQEIRSQKTGETHTLDEGEEIFDQESRAQGKKSRK